MPKQSDLRWKNVSGESMPAGAFFQLGAYIASEKAFEATKWDGTSRRWGVNRQFAIPDDGYGWFDRQQSEHIILHDTANPPDFGYNCGPQHDSWELSNLGGGFRFYGEVSDSFLTGVEFVGWNDILEVELQADLEGATDPDTLAGRPTVQAFIRDWDGSQNRITSAAPITVANNYKNLSFSENEKVKVLWQLTEWQILAADCPD